MSMTDFVFCISIAMGIYITSKVVIMDIGSYVIRLRKRSSVLAPIVVAMIWIALVMILTGFDLLVRMRLGYIPTSYVVVSSLLLGGWAILAMQVFLFPCLDKYLGPDNAE